MIPLRTIYIVTLVSQATSALALAVLAFTDWRVPGIRVLAIACVLHTAATFVMPMWRGAKLWGPEAISAAILPLMFLLIHEGLDSLIQKRDRPSQLWRTGVGATMAIVVALAPWNQLWSMQIARCAAILLIARTMWMLANTQSGSVRIPSLLTAGLLGSILCTFLAGIPIEPLEPASAFLVSLRELTMAEVSLLAFSFLAVYQAESKRLVHEETRRDARTGLLNRRAIREAAAEETRLSEATGKPLALIMMDIDLFKALNDEWGHPFGDEAVRAVASVLRGVADAPRTSAARLSGEEFVLLVPEFTAAAARQVAERLRSAIEALALEQDGRRARVTVSIGVAMRHKGESTSARMLRRADTALYRAKRGGRNRVVLCDEAVDVRSCRSTPLTREPESKSRYTAALTVRPRRKCDSLACSLTCADQPNRRR